MPHCHGHASREPLSRFGGFGGAAVFALSPQGANDVWVSTADGEVRLWSVGTADVSDDPSVAFQVCGPGSEPVHGLACVPLDESKEALGAAVRRVVTGCNDGFVRVHHVPVPPPT